MHSYRTDRIARDLHRERQREIERRLSRRAAVESAPAQPQTSVRNRVGWELIRIGSKLATDVPLELEKRQ